LDDDGPSSAVVSDSLLIFNTESCTIFAVNRFTGDMVWSHWLGDPLLSTPVVSDGRVYTSYPNMKFRNIGRINDTYKNIKPTHPFICMDATDGKPLWQIWLDGDVMVSPVIVDSNIFLTTFSGTLYKINKITGKILACVAMNATSPPTIIHNRVLVTKRADDALSVKESISILDIESLEFIKEFEKKDAPYLDFEVQKESKLKIRSERLDAANGFGGGAPVASGWQLASQNIGQSNVSSLQLFQPSTVNLYKGKAINLMGNTIKSVDPISEKLNWDYKIDIDQIAEGGSVASTPIVVGDLLVTVTLNGRLIVLDCETGKTIFEKETNENVRSSPIVNKGVVFIPTTSGKVLSIDTKLVALDGYPMFMKNSEHCLR